MSFVQPTTDSKSRGAVDRRRGAQLFARQLPATMRHRKDKPSGWKATIYSADMQMRPIPITKSIGATTCKNRRIAGCRSMRKCDRSVVSGIPFRRAHHQPRGFRKRSRNQMAVPAIPSGTAQRLTTATLGAADFSQTKRVRPVGTLNVAGHSDSKNYRSSTRIRPPPADACRRSIVFAI